MGDLRVKLQAPVIYIITHSPMAFEIANKICEILIQLNGQIVDIAQ